MQLNWNNLYLRQVIYQVTGTRIINITAYNKLGQENLIYKEQLIGTQEIFIQLQARNTRESEDR
jgi:hypothetical protein